VQGWQNGYASACRAEEPSSTKLFKKVSSKNNSLKKSFGNLGPCSNFVINMMMIIGLIGSFLILLSWILGLYDEIKSKKNLIEIKFSIINLFGIFFLLIYSLFIKELPFIILNAGLFILILLEIIYSIKVSK